MTVIASVSNSARRRLLNADAEFASPNDDGPSLVLGWLRVWILEKAVAETAEWYDGDVLRVRAECSAADATVTVVGPLFSSNDIYHLLSGMEALHDWTAETIAMTPRRLVLGARTRVLRENAVALIRDGRTVPSRSMSGITPADPTCTQDALLRGRQCRAPLPWHCAQCNSQRSDPCFAGMSDLSSVAVRQ